MAGHAAWLVDDEEAVGRGWVRGCRAPWGSGRTPGGPCPRGLVDEFEVVGVILSLTLTSLILSRLAHTHVLPTIVRSLVIGIAAMGTAALIGSLVT